jgi:protein-disulfide isomerase
MNNENKSKSNSNLPIAIIGLVLVAALIGGWWLYSGSKSETAKSNTNKKTTSTNTAELYAKAAPGANPPNYLGTPSAAVTIEEFADFQCPTCARMHPLVKEMRATYGDRVRIIFREFPLSIPQHDKAYDAAVAAEAAGLQGKFWDMQNMLFANQQSWTRASDFRQILEGYAQKIGLDVEKFKNDMAGIPAKNRVDADLQRGRSLNVNSTPSFYVNGNLLSEQDMTSEGMRRVIDSELQKTQPK